MPSIPLLGAALVDIESANLDLGCRPEAGTSMSCWFASSTSQQQQQDVINLTRLVLTSYRPLRQDTCNNSSTTDYIQATMLRMPSHAPSVIGRRSDAAPS